MSTGSRQGHAFIYPIRLICECKFLSKSITLNMIRSFVGVIKDISENYTIDITGNKNTPNRYTDVGCFFSATSFTQIAQEYAWAHNIFLISFQGLPFFKPILDEIRIFVDRYMQEQPSGSTKQQIIKAFKMERENVFSPHRAPQNLAIGILDGVYPVALISEGDWLQRIDNFNLSRETFMAEKTRRRTDSMIPSSI